MNSRAIAILDFAAQNFLANLPGVLIGLGIASLLVRKLFKNEYRSVARAITYAVFGTAGGVWNYWDTTTLTARPVMEIAILSSVFFVGTLILVTPAIFFRSRTRPSKAA